MVTPSYSTDFSYRTLLQFFPFSPELKKLLWCADFIYQAASFKDIGDYIGMPAVGLAFGSEVGAMAVNGVARAALVGLALYSILPPPRVHLPERPPRPALAEDPFKSGAVGSIPALKASLGLSYEQETMDVFGAEAVRFDPKDPRDKVLYLTGSHDWNKALSPKKSWGVQSLIRGLSQHFDVKYEAVDHPLQICKKVRKAGKAGKVAAVLMHFHGEGGYIALSDETYWKTDTLAYKPQKCGLEWKSVPKEFLPYCFKDGSKDSKLVLMSCYGASQPLDNTMSFAQYLYENTGKTVVSADGLLAQTYFTFENGDLDFQLMGRNGTDLTVVYEKEGFYKPRPDPDQLKPNIYLETIGLLGLCWRTARLTASGAIFAGKVCEYASSKMAKQNRSGAVVACCLSQAKESLSAFGRWLHSNMDSIQGKVTKPIRDAVKKTFRPSLWMYGCRRAARCCLNKTGAFQFAEQFSDRNRSISVECQAAHDETLQNASMRVTTKKGSIDFFYHTGDTGWKIISTRKNGVKDDCWFFDRNLKGIEKKFFEHIDSEIIAADDPLLARASRRLFGALGRCWLELKPKPFSIQDSLFHITADEEQRVMISVPIQNGKPSPMMQIVTKKSLQEFQYSSQHGRWRCSVSPDGHSEEESYIFDEFAPDLKQRFLEKIDTRIISLDEPKLHKALNIFCNAIRNYSPE